MKTAEIANARQLADRQEANAAVNARVQRAQLISSFLDSLLSSDPTRRRLAVSAMLIAMPEEGPQLVKIISETDPDAEVRTLATSSLEQNRQRLLLAIFGADKEVRIAAVKEVIQGWLRDRILLRELLRTAEQDRSNTFGLINTLIILKRIDSALFLSYQQQILALLDSIQSSDAVVKQHVNEVRSRL